MIMKRNDRPITAARLDRDGRRRAAATLCRRRFYRLCPNKSNKRARDQLDALACGASIDVSGK